jgi:TrpR-related protein YerC/YecD
MKRSSKTVLKEPEESWHQLFKAIAVIESAEEANQFFEDLCTPAEIEAMADRWGVVELIKQKIPYRKIYEDTGVSATTVGRVARFITHGAGGYNLIYERLTKRATYEKIQAKNRLTKKREVK